MKYLVTFLVICSFNYKSSCQTVDSIRVFSKSMNKDVRTIVIKPSTYSSVGTKYPVVYLLHGFAGNEKDWIRLVPSIKQLAESTNCIIVCSDAGNSWYINSPSITSSQYETYMAKELVPHIDYSYRTSRVPAKRAITGLSMGGHGALRLAFKYPGTFGAAGSMSGGVDLRGFMKQFDLDKVISDTTAKDFSWKNYSVVQMIDSSTTKSLKLMIDCGVNDFFLDANRSLHQKLLGYRINHEYIERPGGHTWKYWGNAVQYQFFFFKRFFDGSN